MIYIRVDGANIQEIGMGHLYRMMFLANQLFQKTGISPLFIISGYQVTKDILSQNYYKYIEINNKDEVSEILKLSSPSKKDILIIDMLNKHENFIKKLIERYTVISFDDTEGGARNSDIVFNSVFNVPMARENYYCGPNFFLIRSEIAKYNVMEKKISSSVKNLLICLGGSDPCSVNLKMIDWLNGLEFSGRVEWVLGPSVNDKDIIIERFNSLNLDITPIIDYKDIGKLYFDADLCMSAAGFSLYEIACVGLPAITICLYPHQIPTAKRFEDKGSICNLGYYKNVTDVHFKSALYKLFNDQPKRSSMSLNGKAFIDGLGMERVMDKLMNFIN